MIGGEQGERKTSAREEQTPPLLFQGSTHAMGYIQMVLNQLDGKRRLADATVANHRTTESRKHDEREGAGERERERAREREAREFSAGI